MTVTDPRDSKPFGVSLRWEGGYGARGRGLPLPLPQERIVAFDSPDGEQVGAPSPWDTLDGVRADEVTALLVKTRQHVPLR